MFSWISSRVVPLIGIAARAKHVGLEKGEYNLGCGNSSSRRAFTSRQHLGNAGREGNNPGPLSMVAEGTLASARTASAPNRREEGFVQVRACSPEALHRLQSIFDAVWRELERQKGKHTFPWAIEATRFTIARLVLKHVRDLRNPDQIQRDVMRDLERIGDSESPAGSPPHAHSGGARTRIDTDEVRAILEMLRSQAGE